MMKTLSPRLLLTLSSLLSTVAFSAEDINEIMDAAADGTVEISNVAGSVEVQGWSRKQVEVTGELGSDVDELVFERDGSDILIKVKVPSHHGRRTASELIIKIPQASALEINTVSADIEVNDVEGEQELESVSGDIETDAHAEDIDVSSVSGDVVIVGDNKPMRTRLNSVSGDIEADSLSGEIEAETVSGDVEIVNGSFQRAAAHSVNGEIVFHAQLLDDGRLDIETINGEVDIKFDGDVSARFDIETFNGEIRNCFGPESERTSRYTPGRELMFEEGSGSGRVTIQTLNGDIRLCKD
jgi:DUF4097 and DUF4098 domain-containing protein YvlB